MRCVVASGRVWGLECATKIVAINVDKIKQVRIFSSVNVINDCVFNFKSVHESSLAIRVTAIVPKNGRVDTRPPSI